MHKDSKPRKKSLKEITIKCRASALEVGISLVPGEKLCSLCSTHLQKLLVQAPEELPTVVDVPFPGPGPSTSGLNEELPTSMSASTESTSDDSVAHVIDTDEVIQYLNLSPVKLCKLLLRGTGCSSRVSLGKHTGNTAPYSCVRPKWRWFPWS